MVVTITELKLILSSYPVSDILTHTIFVNFNMTEFAALVISAATFVLIYSQAAATCLHFTIISRDTLPYLFNMLEGYTVPHRVLVYSLNSCFPLSSVIFLEGGSLHLPVMPFFLQFHGIETKARTTRNMQPTVPLCLEA